MRIKNIIALLFSSLLMTAILAFSASAADYYVSPDGNAEWPNCTTESNTCHPHTALDNAQAGDTIYFLDGTYSVEPNHGNPDWRRPAWQPVNSGTENNPITFKALNEKQAQLTRTISVGSEGAKMVGTYQQDGIIWDGFIIKVVDENGDVQNALNKMISTSYSAIKNCEIYGGPQSEGGANNIEGLRADFSVGSSVENCIFHGFIETSHSHNTSALKTYEADDFTIKNCEFYNNTVGIYLKGYPHKTATIKNNFFHDNNGYGLLFTVGTIEPSDGDDPANENISIINNIFLGDRIRIDHNTGGKMNDCIVRNNTFYNAGYKWCAADAGRGHKIYNNIFYSDRGLSSYGTGKYLSACDHNRLDFEHPILLRHYEDNEASYSTLTAWQSSDELSDGSNPGTGSITGDPLFLNSSGKMNQISDFKLSVDSPCRGKGRNGSDMGADVSRVGVQSYHELSPPSSLKIIEE